MKTRLDCIPCIVKQAVEAPKRFTEDPVKRARIVQKTAAAIGGFDLEKSPPELGAVLNQIISAELEIRDPYYEDKKRFNQRAVDLLPALREIVSQSENPFTAAVRLAAGANIIDFGAPSGLTDGDIMAPLLSALTVPIGNSGVEAIQRLSQKVRNSQRILYLADNAGEVVVDKLLIEQLPRGCVTVAVRSGPAINDALIEDAKDAGLHKVATLVESGVSIPGTPLSEVSEAFLEIFKNADVIISKGQGNYETLCDEDAPIFFLLTVKCNVVANQLGRQQGDLVVYSSQRKLLG